MFSAGLFALTGIGAFEHMAKLDADQIEFLKKQGISLSLLFDASGLRKKDLPPLMEEVGAYFEYGREACKVGGHTLRTRAGHCIQCKTSKIAYATRHSATAYVYVATSALTGLLKVGLTSDLSDRIAKIRDYKYGGADDWQLRLSVHTDMAGRIEFTTQDQLSRFRVNATYVRAGREQSCMELFRCELSEAEQALHAAVPRTTTIKKH